jgi:hypothetical protein
VEERMREGAPTQVEPTGELQAFILLLLLVGLGLFLLRIYLSSLEVGAARRRRFTELFVLSLPYYVFLVIWQAWGFSLVFFLLEVGAWLALFLYGEGYKSLYVEKERLEEVAERLKRALLPTSPPNARLEIGRVAVIENAEPFNIPLSLRTWAWRIVSGEATVWIFPHAFFLKESGSKWWVPVLPKGVVEVLRQNGQENDILYFPFASFVGTRVAYTGKYYVLTGEGSLDEVTGYLLLIQGAKERMREAKRKKQELLSRLAEALPGWQIWPEVSFEEKGHVDALLRSPSGETYALFFLHNAKDEERMRSLSRWLIYPPVALRLRGEEGGEEKREGEAKFVKMDDLIAWLKERSLS